MAVGPNFRIVNPNTGNLITPRTSNAALIAGKFGEAVPKILYISMRDIVTEASMTANGQAGEAMQIFARSLRNQYARNRTSELRRLHMQVAEDAQTSMLRRYDSIVGARTLGEYRSRVGRKEWKRYSGGMLRAALARPDFYRASYDGILWGNMTMMDRRAKQWYRLNYGAGARGSGYRASQMLPSAKMKFFGQQLTQSLLPESFNASAGYMMPRGIFAELDSLGVEAQARFSRVDLSSIRGGRRVRGSPAEFGIPRRQSLDTETRGAERIQANAGFVRSPFHPIGFVKAGGYDVSNLPKVGPKMTRGFAGAFFIEAGLVRMSQTLPAAYEVQAFKWFKEAATVETGPISKIINSQRADRLMSVTATDIERLASQRNLGSFIRRIR